MEAGRDVILAWRLPSHSTLAPLSVKFPDSSVAGFLTLPPHEPPVTHTCTHTDTHMDLDIHARTHQHARTNTDTCARTRTDGVLMPTYESPGALVRVWLGLEEEWTWWEVWAQRGFRLLLRGRNALMASGEGLLRQASKGALSSCALWTQLEGGCPRGPASSEKKAALFSIAVRGLRRPGARC